MTITRALTCCLLGVLVADDLMGQRRGRGGRRPRPEAETPQPREEKPAAKKKIESWLAVTGADVHLGTGQVLRRATVLMGDDKIEAIGHDLEIPEGAVVIDAKGKQVAPGFVAVKASGMGAPRSSSGDVADSVNAFDPTIKMGLSAGITSFVVSFQEGSSKPGGSSAVIKLAWGEHKKMVVAENTVYSMRVPLSPSQWRDLRDLIKKAKDHVAASRKAADGAKPEAGKPEAGKPEAGKPEAGKPEKPAKEPSGTVEILRILREEAMLWVSCAGTYDQQPISQALEIAELLGRGVVLDGPITAWTMPDAIATTGSMAIINPRERLDPDQGRPDSTGSNIASAAILSEVGVPVAVVTGGGRFGGSSLGTGGILGHDLHTLMIDAAYAVRGGMDNHKALRTLTLDAARIAGVGSRIGSIEIGKDADLLILDGDPLHYRTFVETAIVNGKVVYQKDKEPFYSHIRR